MTLDATKPYIQYTYSGPGTYTFPFKTYKPDTIEVIGIDSTGLQTKWAYNTDYTVTVEPNGGIVTTTRPAGDADTIIIQRVLEFKQDTDWVNQGPFSQELLEYDLDTIVMMIQQLKAELDRKTIFIWRGLWQPQTVYQPNDLVNESNKIWVCVEGHTSTDYFPGDVGMGWWQMMIDLNTV